MNYDNYEPPEPDYEPEYIEHQRYTPAHGMPTLPIDPLALVDRVSKQLESYGLVVPDKSPAMIGDMGKGFNQCIQDNQSKAKGITYIYSPKTGSAKSVTAKMYISMLQEESSLVIVPSVKDALEFCKDINDWSANPKYARCTYAITEDNPDNELRVKRDKLNEYRCIVITHANFIQKHEFKNDIIGLFKSYKENTRDLVIVDERIGFYQKHYITDQRVRGLIEVFSEIATYYEEDLREDIEGLKKLLVIFERLKELTSTKKTNHLLLSKSQRQEIGIERCTFENINKMIKDYTIDLESYTNKLRIGDSNVHVEREIKAFLRSIEFISSHDYSFHKSGSITTLMAIENLLSEFGSHVVLDATAEINEIYETSTKFQSETIKHIFTENPRIYSNFTINKAIGYPQGADSIYKTLPTAKQESRAKIYINIANNLLTDPDDKILIVAHKDFLKKLKRQNNNSKIVFTNWGNHVGKNKWSECNKVMIIGWLHLPEKEYYAKFISAVGNLDSASRAIDSPTKKKKMIRRYKVSQFVDDLVQATMRGSTRTTISKDGNCAISEAYIFYPRGEEGENVLKGYEAEFKGVRVKEWEPDLKENIPQKLTQHSTKIELIITYLKEKAKTEERVSRQTIIKDTDISKSVMGRIFNKEEFKLELRKHNYQIGKIDGRSTGIIFR